MKYLSLLVTLAIIPLMAGIIAADYFIGLQYENEIGAYWELADKSSTIAAKVENIDKFILAIDSADLAEYGAVIGKTQNNNTEANVAALKTLQTRLHEIEGMDVSSFEYQQAISQITGQEMGEAAPMLSVIYQAWYLGSHPIMYFSGILLGVLLVLLIAGASLTTVLFGSDY